MAIYIDKEYMEEQSAPGGDVLAYVLSKHRDGIGRLQRLYDAYMTKQQNEDETTIAYPHYIVQTLLGFYLGDPIKYALDEDDDSRERWIVNGGEVKAAPRTLAPEADITPILSAYKHQTISEVDSVIGRDIGIYGEAYELLYASSDANPIPKSTVCDPRNSFMVRDNSTDHNKLFFVTYEKREKINGTEYTALFVYTDTECLEYRADDVAVAQSYKLISSTPHFFGEVPAVEYRNNADRLGDFELVMPLINKYNTLLDNRLTDKEKFVDAILALYGATLDDDGLEALKEMKFVDGLPNDSKLEYIQKTFNESSVQVLADNLVKDIHKLAMVVDMSDDAFGTASGVALKMKLSPMTQIAKNKIRSLEKGLKKRFEMYNYWLTVKGEMGYVSRDDISLIFTISIPSDEQVLASVVKMLEGTVDRETLLSILPFVKDPKASAEKAKQEAAEAQDEYLDTFGITAKRNENIGGDDDEEDGTDS